MRVGAGFNATAVVTVAMPMAVKSNSAWHSPVLYLFGGVAAMLGLIAFALLLLACSYWKLSRYLDGSRNGGDADSVNNDGKKNGEVVKGPAYFCEGIVVIMAGDEEPTFLATPIPKRASSFEKQRSNSGCSSSSENGSNKLDGLDDEKMDEGIDGNDSDPILIETEDQNQSQEQ